MTARHKEHTLKNVRLTGVETRFKIENRSISRGAFSSRRPQPAASASFPGLGKLYLDRDCIGQLIQFNYHTFQIIGIVEERPRAFFEGQGDRIEVFIPFRTVQSIRKSWIDAMASCKSTNLAEEARAELIFFLRQMRQVKHGEPNNFDVFIMESEVMKVRSLMAVLVWWQAVSISRWSGHRDYEHHACIRL